MNAISLRIVGAVLRQPRLWSTALVQWKRLTPPGWWKQRPFLPVPDGDYLQFRALTQYGDGGHRLAADDVTAYLQWCQRQRQAARQETPQHSTTRIH